MDHGLRIMFFGKPARIRLENSIGHVGVLCGVGTRGCPNEQLSRLCSNAPVREVAAIRNTPDSAAIDRAV